MNEWHATTLPARYLSFAAAFNDGAHITPKHFTTFSIHNRSSIIPSDPITIINFRIDRDYIWAIEWTAPQLHPPSLPITLVERSPLLLNPQMNPNSGSTLILLIPSPPLAITKQRTKPKRVVLPACSTKGMLLFYNSRRAYVMNVMSLPSYLLIWPFILSLYITSSFLLSLLITYLDSSLT